MNNPNKLKTSRGQITLETLIVVSLILIPITLVSAGWGWGLWGDLQCRIQTFDQARLLLVSDSIRNSDFVLTQNLCKGKVYTVKLWKLHALEMAL